MSSIAFCSKCNHSELYGEIRSSVSGHVQVKHIKKPEFCAKCGAKMLYGCPNCGVERRSMKDKFCIECGKPYK